MKENEYYIDEDDTISCFEYGSSGGCDELCPVLNKGQCSLYEDVEHFLLGIEK